MYNSTFAAKNILYSVAILGITLMLLVSCTASRSVESTPSTSTGPGFNFLTGTEARTALEELKTKVLIIPEEAQEWKLESVQIPDRQEEWPFLFTYTDGKRIVSLTQVHGEELSFQPVGTAVGTMNGTVKVRGGKDAFYTETTLEQGRITELVWSENGLAVLLRSEQVDRVTLVAIANMLIYSK